MTQLLEIGELPAHTALIDLGSISDFVQSPNGVRDFVLGADSHFVETAKAWVDKRIPFGALLEYCKRFRGALAFLEHTVVHPRLVLDAALRLNPMDHEIVRDINQLLGGEGKVSYVQVPDGLRQQALQNIRENNQACERLNASIGFHAGDKSVHDLLYRLGSSAWPESNDTAQRAFYYLEISQLVGLPLLLSPPKARILRDVVNLLPSNPHTAITEAALGNLKRFPMPIPPLQEYIVARAALDRCSPLIAASRIASGRDALDYRRLVGELVVLSRGTSSDRQQADQALADIERQMKDWRRDPDLGIVFKEKIIDIGEVPLIGWIAKVFDLPKLTIKDPILGGPERRAFVFMSRWFQPLT